MGIKKGDPVEFTILPVAFYVMGSGTFGIATEDERSDHSVTVELASGETCRARHIHAYAWKGYLPEDLEDAYARHNLDAGDGLDDY